MVQEYNSVLLVQRFGGINLVLIRSRHVPPPSESETFP